MLPYRIFHVGWIVTFQFLYYLRRHNVVSFGHFGSPQNNQHTGNAKSDDDDDGHDTPLALK